MIRSCDKLHKILYNTWKILYQQRLQKPVVLGRCRCCYSTTSQASPHISNTRATCVNVGWPVWQHSSRFASKRMVAGMGQAK